MHFRDGDLILDQAVLEALAVPAPPAGTEYEVWLGGPEERISLGILLLDDTGKGTRTYNASTGENLLAKYDRVEIAIKPTDANSSETERVAYSYTLPPDGLIYIRQLLVTDTEIPNQTALIQALAADTLVIEQNVSEIQKAYANSDKTQVRMNAESIVNVLTGSQSPEHKDWNGDRQISDSGTGFGFLLNGSNQGYVQAVFAHADYVANSAGASQNMIVRGGEVKVCVENLAQWIPQLKEQAQNILNAASLTEMEKPIQAAVMLAKNIQSGADINGNLKIELLTGECGVVDLYKSAYAMADMPLLPVNALGTSTATAEIGGTPSPAGTVIIRTPTKRSGGSGGSANTPVPAQPTKNNNPGGGGGNTPPGQEKTPKPKP